MSSQLAVKLTVLCSGADASGKTFDERTRTTLIEKNGGRILLQPKLQPGARLQIRLLARPDRAAEITLEKMQESGEQGAEWSFHFSSPVDDFWGVRFPSERAAHGKAETVAASAALAEMTEQLVLLSAHADDHLRYCGQEMEQLRQRFARELQNALDSGARQLQQIARSTMQTTFRSLLEDLARRAEQTVDESLGHLRKTADEIQARVAKHLDDSADIELKKIEERLEKQAKHFAAQLEELQGEAHRAMQDTMHEALTDFQAGCAGLFRDVLHATETHKATRAAARRK